MATENSPAPTVTEVQAQLARILASSDFTGAERAARFLRFLVEETLAGRGDQLKEYSIAIAVFDRDASFDPSTNPAIRVEASRLRRRLEHYYLTHGHADPLLIEIPRGTYVPAFSPRADVLHLEEDLAAALPAGAAAGALFPIGLPGGPAIAVLPFENLGEAGDALLGDGITVEIITALARFREFHVLGRNTVFQHRGTRNAQTLHRELGVDYVLDGSLRREANRLRVNAQLVVAATGVVAWVERYERDWSVGSIFEIQDEIANHVVSTVAQPHGVIARPQLAVAKRKPPEQLDTYDCLLLFYDYAAHHMPATHATVRAALEQEVTEEPSVSSLWAALSIVHTDTWRFGFNAEGARADAREQGLQEAHTAVELDPMDPLAYHALFLAQFVRGDLKGFHEAADRALSLNPNNSDILADYGLHLTLCGEMARGIVLLKVALSLNPEPPDWYWFPFFLWHFERQEFEGALDMALRARSEEFFWTHLMHAVAYAAVGMPGEARAAGKRLLDVYPGFPAVARTELARWVGPARVESSVALLARAGIAIPRSK
jgi:adenylate cyclase